ncbi:MAG: N-formylglutamate amidohydrolase [Alphaproteobacteria bacterium]|mgnify:CR=1 FL=1|jgi:N-formylglutamate amidohydrolase|nr:N-formylglutamate amidohydrolase [Alphaproteobacteria bacterium]MDP6516184.1 N-formylglutamate amidohydrolase [Alphaproteobacteria bacterium]
MVKDANRSAGTLTPSAKQGDFGVGFAVAAPARQTVPLVLASPHSGRRYGKEFLALSRLGIAALRRSEDSFVDELVGEAPARGAPVLRALFPRALVDVNREPLELDPAMFTDRPPAYANTTSPRVHCGLGTIPRVAASGAAIYRRRLAYGQARARILDLYFPYHRTLRQLLAETVRRFGFAILIDCHSMPSQAANAAGGGQGLDIVLGDRHGAACAAIVVARAEAVLRERGYRVGRNRPYAGGFTTKYYGRPDLGVHAVQIEINRALYMDENRVRRGPHMKRLAADLGILVDALGQIAPFARAAE